MDYEDRLTIATPEGVDVELSLAGLGSRLGAALIDRIIQLGLVLGLVVGVMLPSMAAGSASVFMWVGALFFILYFLVEFGYHVLFETMWSGRTPGKRALSLRVLRTDGIPIRFREAAVRALVLLLDGPLSAYAVGTICILVSSRNQRVGDIVAGTVVVRERSGGRSGTSAAFDVRTAVPDAAATWDVGGVSDTDLSTLRRFLERRDGLSPDARTRLAAELAWRMRPRVAGAVPPMEDEAFIEAVVAVKSRRN